MKITEIKVFRYSLPLKSPVRLAKTTLEVREGLIIQLANENELLGFGEIAPFPGFSRESLGDAESQVLDILSLHPDSIDSRELENMLKGFYPSVQFGIESALLDLRAKERSVNISQFLSRSPLKSVSVNGLLTGSREDILRKAREYSEKSYKAVKLKVGSNNLDTDIEITREVRGIIGEYTLLRLDANRAWTAEKARDFCDSVGECDIDYLEEPVLDSKILRAELNGKSLSVPIALDETTREVSPDELAGFKNVKAVVLKPMLLGVSRTLKFAREAHDLGITPVIGSSFESGLGLSILANLAAAVNFEDVPAGLDTYSWYKEDIIPGSLPVRKGRINILELPAFETVLESPVLKESVAP